MRDPESLAERILYLLENEGQATEMGLRGRETARVRYDRKTNLAEMARMWEATAAAPQYRDGSH